MGIRNTALVREDGGQMVVELVALIPVMLIVAAIAANLIAYMGACAMFDRAAAEAVRVEVVEDTPAETDAE